MALLKNSIYLKNIFSACSKQILIRSETRNIARWVSPTLRELKRRRDKVGPEPERPRSAFLDWNYEAELYAFGPRLNEHFNLDVLRIALTHRSYLSTEIQTETESNVDNTALVQEGEEFMLNFLSEYIRRNVPNFPEEGQKAVRDYLMSEQCLSHVATHIGLKDIILCAEFPVSENTLSTTFKAVIAALVRSSDQRCAENFLRDFIGTQLNGKDINELWTPSQTPMEQLEVFLTKQGKSLPEARLCNTAGVNTILATYRVGLYDENKQLLGIGWGESVEIATDVAARNALARIYGTTESMPQFNFGSAKNIKRTQITS